MRGERQTKRTRAYERPTLRRRGRLTAMTRGVPVRVTDGREF